MQRIGNGQQNKRYMIFPRSQSQSCWAVLPGQLAESRDSAVPQNCSDTFW